MFTTTVAKEFEISEENEFHVVSRGGFAVIDPLLHRMHRRHCGKVHLWVCLIPHSSQISVSKVF